MKLGGATAMMLLNFAVATFSLVPIRFHYVSLSCFVGCRTAATHEMVKAMGCDIAVDSRSG